MIYNLLSRLFHSDEGTYTARPVHLIYSLLYMSVGIKTMDYEGWAVFGFISFILGFLLGLSIIICMNWEKVIAYWEVINEHIRLMNRINNPDLWYALGYKQVPQSVRVIEDLNEVDGVYTQTKYHELKDLVSPAIMQSIANVVLSGNPFSENEIVKRKIISSPKFRKLQKEFETKGFIKPHNTKHRNQGFTLTHRGYNVLFEFASEAVKLQLKGYSE